MAKVCILTSVHPVFDTRVLHKEAKTLARAGYPTTLIAQHDKEEVIDGVRVVPLPIPKNRFERIVVTLRTLLSLALKEKADVYHFHDPEVIPVGVILKLMGKKVIIDVHEDYPKAMLSRAWIPPLLRPFMAFCMGVVVSIFALCFDRVIVAGNDIAESFPDFLFGKKLLVIRNVPLASFIETCKLDKADSDLIVYVGYMTRIRGIAEVARAMEYTHERARLKLVGMFQERDLEEEVLALDNPRIEITGHIDFTQLPGILAEAKIGLICFHEEPNHIGAFSGRNNKLYEYMCGGLAIVASNLPTWKEAIEDEGIGILVDPTDPRAIAEAINVLLDDPVRVKQMSERGRELVASEYNWDVEGEKLLDAYAKLVGTP